jgi:hypothetical protein
MGNVVWKIGRIGGGWTSDRANACHSPGSDVLVVVHGCNKGGKYSYMFPLVFAWWDVSFVTLSFVLGLL